MGILETLKVGDTIRLKTSVDRYPEFMAPAGATGKVIYNGADYLEVQMHDYIAGAEPWDNSIIWAEAQETGLEEGEIELCDEPTFTTNATIALVTEALQLSFPRGLKLEDFEGGNEIDIIKSLQGMHLEGVIEALERRFENGLILPDAHGGQKIDIIKSLAG